MKKAIGIYLKIILIFILLLKTQLALAGGNMGGLDFNFKNLKISSLLTSDPKVSHFDIPGTLELWTTASETVQFIKPTSGNFTYSIANDSGSFGTIDQNGLYTAPKEIAQDVTITIQLKNNDTGNIDKKDIFLRKVPIVLSGPSMIFSSSTQRTYTYQAHNGTESYEYFLMKFCNHTRSPVRLFQPRMNFSVMGEPPKCVDIINNSAIPNIMGVFLPNVNITGTMDRSKGIYTMPQIAQGDEVEVTFVVRDAKGLAQSKVVKFKKGAPLCE